MNRQIKSFVKKSENSNQAKYKQLQNEFDEYKSGNDIKVSAITDLRKVNEELVSLNLWSARRLRNAHKDFAYNDLERITKRNHERV